MTDPFSTPQKPYAAGTGPTLRCIGARLVAIVPKTIYRQEVNPFYDSTKPESYNNTPLRDRMVCDLILVSGQPFMYGGNDKDVPDTQGPFPVPGVVYNWEIDRPAIVNSIKPTDVGGGVVIGHFHQVKTAKGNMAWNFGEAPAAGTPERNFAIQVFEAYKNGQLPTHVPTEPVANPVQPAYTAPNGTQIPFTQPFGQGGPQGQQPQQQFQPAMAQASPHMAQPMGGQMAPVNPQQPAWPQPGVGGYPSMPAPPPFQPQQSAPPAAPYGQPDSWAQVQQQPAGQWQSLQTAPVVEQAPPGLPQNIADNWATLAPPQRDMIRQQYAAQIAQASGQPQMAGPSYP